MNMKIHLFIILIAINAIDGKPKIHFGRCNVNSVSGYCIAINACDTVSQNELLGDSSYGAPCEDIESTSTLVCCPNTRPAPVKTITTTQPQRLASVPPVWPEPPACGNFLNDRIVGGTNTSLTEYPWMALLRYTQDNINFVTSCGGSLVSSRWVITAAHCVVNQQKNAGYNLHSVRLGEWNLETESDCIATKTGIECLTHLDIPVDKIISHPEYVGLATRFLNDIAIVHLSENAPSRVNIYPICLPEPVDRSSNIAFANELMFISGWGMTMAHGYASPVKLKATLTVWSAERCSNIINSIQRRAQQPVNLQFCASGDNGQSSCKGDSGGPVMNLKLKNNNYYYYINGIISSAITSACNTINYPVIFTRVESYITWIRNEMSAHT